MKLLSYSITEKGETTLHVAASAKDPKHLGEFVQKLVDMMDKDDVTLQNSNHNTTLYLAAAAGNVEAVKIMVNKNRALLTIAGSNGTMMPLYTAALFGNHDVVKYMYENSYELGDIGWDPQNRGWLLVKCVENDMFVPPKTIVKSFLDVALKIVKKYPELGTSTGTVLGILVRKPEAFAEAKSNIIQNAISLGRYWGKHIYSKMNITHKSSQNDPEHGNVSVIGDMVRKHEKKSDIIVTGKHLYSSSVIGKTISSGRHQFGKTLFSLHELTM
nr:ankyrin repeat-containing domain, PGG domain protein [Tanacetum cinerariifolium]